MSVLPAKLDPRHFSIRVRVALLSLVTVAIALAVFSVVLVIVQRELLTERIDDSLDTRARDIGAVLRSGQSLSGINEGGEEAFIQVLGDDGSLIAASDNVAGQPAFSNLEVAANVLRFTDASGLVRGDFDRFRVAVFGVETADGLVTVLVGRNLESVTDSTETLVGALLFAVPALALFVGVAAWFLAGRALKPVDTMRSEVDSIGGEIAGRRVEEPRTDDEVARLAQTMNRMLERVDAVQQGQKRFVADASHELRTPLTAFRAGLEAGIDTSGDEATAETLRSLLSDADRMESLIEELLEDAVETARTEDERTRPVRVDLDDIVLEQAAAIRLGTAIAVDTTGVSGAQVNGVASQLRRAVRNLLSNAVRHAESAVTVALSEDDDGVRLVVVDDGPGIPAEDRERIFERFVRLDAARASGAAGSGLGLTITRRIVEAHGGRVYVDADFASGARFVVEIPK